MVSYRMIAVAGFLASVNALPLNINLGAYSPALVVGDGEISFGGGQDVSQLMNTLEGAAVDAATGAASGATEGAAVATPSTPANEESAVAAADIESSETESSETAEAPVATPSSGASTESANTDTASTDTASTEAASTESTDTESANAEADPILEEEAQQIAGLQGMGKEIAPREGEEVPKAKRDLAGFDRALTFAEAALTKGPTVQLGNGEGGAGIGIIVDNTGRPAGEAAEAEGAAAAKRDETSAQPRRRTKITHMYVKRGIPADVQTSSEFETRSVESLPVVNLPALSKRDGTSEAIDAINLNVDGEEGMTLTFVETTEDDEAQEPME